MFLFQKPIQRLHFGSLAVYPLVACCVLLAAAQAQEAMLHDGQPALMFRADPDLTIAVDLVDHNGERALRFPVVRPHSTCRGYLYVFRSHVSYDPILQTQLAQQQGISPEQLTKLQQQPQWRCAAFEFDHNDFKSAQIGKNHVHEYELNVDTKTVRLVFMALFDFGSEKRAFGDESALPLYRFIVRSLGDFDSALHEAETLTASLSQHPQQEEQQHAEEQPAQSGEPAKSASASSVELKEGQTPEDVEKALGKPEDKTTYKDTVIYSYVTVKVIFEHGKLVNVEERKAGVGQKSEVDVSGHWRATFADSIGSGTVEVDLVQDADGSVTGTYAASSGGGGTIEGVLQGNTLTYTNTQTIQNCPGRFTGTITFVRDTASGKYEGRDCRGTIKNGVITQSRVKN